MLAEMFALWALRIKSIKDMLQFAFRNARAFILHADGDHRASIDCPQGDTTVGGGEALRVSDKIAQHLDQPTLDCLHGSGRF